MPPLQVRKEGSERGAGDHPSLIAMITYYMNRPSGYGEGFFCMLRRVRALFIIIFIFTNSFFPR